MEHHARCVYEIGPANYLAAGITSDALNGGTAYYLRFWALDGQGKMVWDKKYGNEKYRYVPNYFVSRSFYRKNNTLFYAGQVIDSTDEFISVVMKFDLSGNLLWEKQLINIKGRITPQAVTQGVDGGLLVIADFTDSVNAIHPGLMIKLDQAGNTLWQKEFHKSAPDIYESRQIVQDSATKKIVFVAIEGVYNSVGSEGYGAIYITDSLGNELDRRRFGRGIMNDLIQTQDKKFVATGINNIDSLNRTMPKLIKFGLNDLDQPDWEINNFASKAFVNSFWCLRELPNGDLLVAGNYDTLYKQHNYYNALSRFTRFSAGGIMLSNACYDYGKDINATNQQRVVSVEPTSDGGWIAASWVIRQNYPNFIFMQVVKYDANGCDSSLAYCSNRLGLSPHVFSGLQIYPQPAGNELRVKTELADPVFELNDLYGRRLECAVSGQEKGAFTLSLNHVPPGVYLLRIKDQQGNAYVHKLLKD